MPHTEHFVVKSDSKKVIATEEPSYEYWRGKLKGTIDMEIEVFGYNHKEEAQKIYDALKAAGLENKYVSIKVETK